MEQEGRFVKIILTDKVTELILTLAYLESQEENNLDLLPNSISTTDIVMGDLNKVITHYYKYTNLYHIKDINNRPKFFPVINAISDHINL